MEEAASRDAWRAIRNAMPFTGDARVLWRISAAPARGHEVMAAIGEGAEHFDDWAGGLIWIAMPV